MVSAVILAGGRGSRVGFKKQFFRVGGRRVLEFSVEVFRSLGIEDIVLVLPKEDVGKFDGLRVVEGGKERMDSVYNGVLASRGEYVLIHDSARANLSLNLAKRVLETEGDCVIPVIRPSDSIIFDGNYLDRERVFLVQTPQKVKRELFLEAYSKADKIYPDEGSLIKGVLGIEPTFVEGERWNFKITYPEDLEVFGKLKMESLNLFGYDIHRLEEGRKLFLGGVLITEEFGAIGHSDGDVIIHAIVDALLSGLGYGDIGTNFPDTDPRWKDAKSEVFARKTMEILKKEGYRITFLDITVILQKPKLEPYREEIMENLKRLFEVDRISLKAKSGNTFFEGSVQCYALVRIER
jgi:2-C-methyl-D-erythritol 4-phosphate cytidylyltransferase/2-C-methyl-D-erythritol 2,4-cyclodiphosphate synthase